MNRRAILRVGLLIAVVGAGALAWVLPQGKLNPAAIETGIGELGAWAPLIFVAAFAIGTALFVPGSIFGLASGVLFGPLWGTVWNLAGGTLGASIAFLVARFVAADWIAARSRGRLKTILSGVEAEGWRFVALTRLVPIVPFNLLNYTLGLTRIPLSHYLLATLVCMAPGTLAYAWLGYAGRAALQGNSDALRYGVLGLAALALIAFAPRLIRRLKEQSVPFISLHDLKRGMVGERQPLVVDVREPDEFAGPLGHVPGAVNIPLGELPGRCHDLKNRNDVSVIVVCRTDRRSAKAAAVLQTCGIGNVAVLRGGMEAWRKEAVTQ